MPLSIETIESIFLRQIFRIFYIQITLKTALKQMLRNLAFISALKKLQTIAALKYFFTFFSTINFLPFSI